MLCKIADIVTSVPDVGDLSLRCTEYLYNEDVNENEAEIVINKERLLPLRYPTLTEYENYYLETGFNYYHQLLRYDGLMLHSSCVVLDGYAYLFSGPCGIGKSTHVKKWIDSFPSAVVINDDKPAVRRIDGKWFAFGTPWCGKDGINKNVKAPIAGICFLSHGDRNFKKVSPLEVLPVILSQTVGRSNEKEAKVLMSLINLLLKEVPIYGFENHADQGDEFITFENMKIK